MKKTIAMIAVSAAFSMSALAGNWSGRLLDANCYSQKTDAAACSATNATTQFVFEASGKVYKLDSAGNSKAAAALKNRAPADPAKASEVMAQISGTENDGTISVESIEVK